MSEEKAKIAAAMAALGLTVEAEFVPFSQSRNAAKDADGMHLSDRSLNWRVTLKRNGAPVLTTDYSAGIAYCPAYSRLNVPGRMGRGFSLEQTEAIRFETEKGRWAPRFASMPIGGAAILPEPVDVVHSLILDAGAIDYPTFEQFAEEYGFDPDSRKGEAAYRACLKTAIKLRAAIGDAGIEALRQAGEGY